MGSNGAYRVDEHGDAGPSRHAEAFGCLRAARERQDLLGPRGPHEGAAGLEGKRHGRRRVLEAGRQGAIGLLHVVAAALRRQVPAEALGHGEHHPGGAIGPSANDGGGGGFRPQEQVISLCRGTSTLPGFHLGFSFTLYPKKPAMESPEEQQRGGGGGR